MCWPVQMTYTALVSATSFHAQLPASLWDGLSMRRALCTVMPGDTGDQATEAMHAIADAVTQCKFEATDPAADEVVLYKILQVSHALP